MVSGIELQKQQTRKKEDEERTLRVGKYINNR